MELDEILERVDVEKIAEYEEALELGFMTIKLRVIENEYAYNGDIVRSREFYDEFGITYTIEVPKTPLGALIILLKSKILGRPKKLVEEDGKIVSEWIKEINEPCVVVEIINPNSKRIGMEEVERIANKLWKG